MDTILLIFLLAMAVGVVIATSKIKTLRWWQKILYFESVLIVTGAIYLGITIAIEYTGTCYGLFGDIGIKCSFGDHLFDNFSWGIKIFTMKGVFKVWPVIIFTFPFLIGFLLQQKKDIKFRISKITFALLTGILLVTVLLAFKINIGNEKILMYQNIFSLTPVYNILKVMTISFVFIFCGALIYEMRQNNSVNKL